jgi:hypothetical protein
MHTNTHLITSHIIIIDLIILVHCFMPPLAALAGEGMVGKSFDDPPAMLEGANAAIKAATGL